MQPAKDRRKRLAVVGHGRGATSFAAAWLNKNGILVKHERMGPEGIVESGFSVPTWGIRGGVLQGSQRDDFDFDHKLCVLRDPWKVIATYYAIEHPDAIWLHAPHINLDDAYASRIDAIALSVVAWTNAGRAWADAEFKGEEANDVLPGMLEERGFEAPEGGWQPTPANRVNHRLGRRMSKEDIQQALRPSIRDQVIAYAEGAGYGS
jgi:hypothetical protein